MSALISTGSTLGFAYLSTYPYSLTRNFPKFHGISFTYPFCLSFNSEFNLKNLKTSCVFFPLTSIFENIGNSTSYLLTKALISYSVPGSYFMN